MAELSGSLHLHMNTTSLLETDHVTPFTAAGKFGDILQGRTQVFPPYFAIRKTCASLGL
jgi:hypothetical protein